MESPVVNLILADILLFIHVVIVLFIVLGLVFVYIGKFFFWSWVRNPWFRVSHLIAICIVAIQSWFGIICPLTTWEMALREQAGDVVYSGSFISHWLETLLYYQAPAWVFIVCYTIFGLLVVASWFIVRPRRFIKRKANAS